LCSLDDPEEDDSTPGADGKGR
jgi:hypothetical protein